jgi:hypothetical protein
MVEQLTSTVVAPPCAVGGHDSLNENGRYVREPLLDIPQTLPQTAGFGHGAMPYAHGPCAGARVCFCAQDVILKSDMQTDDTDFCLYRAKASR